MIPGRFSLDSNLLVYAVDARHPDRQAAAVEIIARAARRDCVLSLQALAEFFHAASRKGIMPRPDAAAQVRSWAIVFVPLAVASESALRHALLASESGQFQFYDALMLATVAEAGVTALVSEDMARSAALNGVRIVAAFTPEGRISEAARTLL